MTQRPSQNRSFEQDDIQVLLNQGKISPREALTKVLEQYPDDHNALRSLGVIALEEGEIGIARDYFERLAASRPNDKEAKRILMQFAMLYDGDIGPEYIKKTLRKAVNPDTGFVQPGVKLLSRGKLAEAIDLLAEGEKYFPDNIGILCNLGIAYSRHGDIPNAKEYFRKVLSINSTNATACRNLGEIAFDEEDYVLAEMLLRIAVEKNPSDHVSKGLLRRMGVTMETVKMPMRPEKFIVSALRSHSVGQLDQAIRILRSGLEQFPGNQVMLCHLGYFYIEQKNTVSAKECYEEVLVSNPTNVTACRNLGQIAFDEEDYETAYRLLRIAKEKNPHDRFPNRFLNQINDFIRETIARPARDLYSAGKFNEAMQILNEALEKFPNNTIILCNIGRAYSATGDQQTAKIYLEQALSIDPHNLNACHSLGVVAYEEGDYELAEKLLKKFADRYSDNNKVNRLLQNIKDRKYLAKREYSTPEELVDIARAHRTNKDIDIALNLLLEGIGRFPDNEEVMDEIAFTLVKKNEPKEAQKWYEKILKRNSKSDKAWVGLAKIEIQTGNNKRACQFLISALSVNPDNRYALQTMGRLSVDQGDLGTARRYLERLSAAYPEKRIFKTILHQLSLMEEGVLTSNEYINGHLRRTVDYYKDFVEPGKALIRDEKFDEALELFQEASKYFPDRDLAFFHIGRIYYDKGDYSSARLYLNKAVELYPEDRFSLHYLGKIAFNEYDYDKAESHFKRILETTPSHTGALYYLGKIALKLNNPQAAENYFEKVLQIDPDHRGSIKALGEIALQERSVEEVRELLEETMDSSDSSDIKTLHLAGELALKEEDSEGLADYFEKLYATPMSEEAWGNHVVMFAKYLRLNKSPDLAIDILEMAIEKLPKDQYIICSLAHLYMLQGDPAEAEALLEEAILVNPNDVVVLQLFGQLEEAKGNTHEAYRHYRHADTIDPDNTWTEFLLKRLNEKRQI